jgi:hypothetical protein
LSANHDAFTKGVVNPRRAVAGWLFLFGPDGAGDGKEPTAVRSGSPKLPPGRYLIKVYIDRKNRLTDDPTVFLGEAEYAGQAEIQAKWGEGFPQAEAISGKLMK